MGIFNNKGLAQSLAAKAQGRAAMQSAIKSNPNSTAKDYLQAGMNPLNMMVAKAKAAQASRTLPAGQSGFARMAQNAVANRAAAQINPMQPTPISPTAFTNQDAIGGMFGAANNGTFTRTVGDTPIMQMADPGYMDPMSDVDPGVVSSEPMFPPAGVDQSITPTYDLSNQQL